MKNKTTRQIAPIGFCALTLNLTLTLALAFTLSISLSPTIATATVGGSTTVSDFKYNPEDESIYYVQTSESGRGCPPMLYKIGLVSEKDEVVYSCEMGEAFLYQKREDGKPFSPEPPSVYTGVYSEFEVITENFKTLYPIDLSVNRISVNVSYEGEGGTNPVAPSQKVLVSVLQNNVVIDTFAATACSIDQPFRFHGYAIPGFNKKIMLLFSAKRNCFEGGYIDESVHIINNITNLDRVHGKIDLYKTSEILTPDSGSIVTYNSAYIRMPNESNTSDQSNVPNTTTQTQESGSGSSQIVLLSIIAILLALIAGILIGKMKYR